MGRLDGLSRPALSSRGEFLRRQLRALHRRVVAAIPGRAAAWPLLAALCLLPAGATAQDETEEEERVLVSNIDQGREDTSNLRSYDIAQRFRIGRYNASPVLTSVEIEFQNLRASGSTLRVYVYRSNGGATDQLNTPSSFRTSGYGTLTFTASGDGIELVPNEHYYIILDSNRPRGNLVTADSSSEDDSSLNSWGIDDDKRRKVWNRSGLQWFRSHPHPARIRINGNPGTPAAVIESITLTSVPMLTWPGSSSPDVYGPGETIEFTVTFSAAVTVVSDPVFRFGIGDSTRQAIHDRDRSTATTAVFRYTVQDGDEDADGIEVGDQTNTFSLDGNDRIEATANRTLWATLDHEELGILSGHKVGVPPAVATVTSFAVSSTPGLTSPGASMPDTYGRAEEIEFAVAFSEAVSVTGDPEIEFVIAGGDTRRAPHDASASTAETLVFRYVVQNGDRDTDGIETNGLAAAMQMDEDDTILTTSSDWPASLDHDALGAQSGHRVDGSTTAAAALTNVDVTSTPLMTSPGASTPDTYGRGETIEFTATFDAPVTVTGDPALQFSIGAATRRATYDASASTPDTLVFRYVVQSGDRDAGGIETGDHTTTFMGDTDYRIRTTSNEVRAILDHDSLDTESGHRVDGSRTVAATSTSFALTSRTHLRSAGATSPDTYGRGETIEFTATFDAPVTVTGAPEVRFTLGEATRQAPYDASASTADTLVFRYVVHNGDLDADGIEAGDHTTTFMGAADDRIRTTEYALSAILDHPPLGTRSDHKVNGLRSLEGTATIVSVAVTSTPLLTSPGAGAPDSYGRGETIDIAATFDSPVTVTGVPELEFALGEGTRRATHDASASTPDALVFRYPVQADDRDTDGIAVDSQRTALRLGASDHIRATSVYEDAILDHDSLDTRSGHRVDGSRTVAAQLTTLAVTSTPLLTSPGGSTPDTYGRAETIEFTATFDAPVTVTGVPELEFALGEATGQAPYDASASTVDTLVFRYVVQDGDRDADGIAAGDHTTTFKGATDDRIRTTSNDVRAFLDHEPLAAQSGRMVDGSRTVAATVESVAVTSRPHLRSSGVTTPDTYGLEDTIGFTVTFSAGVTVTGVPELEFELGNATRRAAYDASASAPDTLVFRYTVLGHDSDADGIAAGDHTTTFKANTDDRIRTTSNHVRAILDHEPLGTLSDQKVSSLRSTGGTARVESVAVSSTPLLTSSGAGTPDTYGRGERIRFTATLSAPVRVTGTPELEFTLGDAARRALYVAGASTANTLAFRYTVRAGDGDPDGIAVSGPTAFRLDAGDHVRTTSIFEDAILDHDPLDTRSGHRVDGSQSVVAEITTVAVTSTPAFTSPDASTPDTYRRGDTIELTVTFSEPVTVTGTPELGFSIGSGAAARRAVHDAGASTASTMVFRYPVLRGDADTDGIAVGDHTTTFRTDIDDRIRTTANGAPAVLVHDPLAPQPGHRVDGSMTEAATVDSVAVTSTPDLRSSVATTPDTYGVGDTIGFSVTFSGPVTVTGTPALEFALDDGTREATFVAGASTTTVLAFRYTVLSGDRAAGGISVGDHTTTFKAITDERIQTTANDLHAVLDHDPLGTQSGHRVDGSRSTSGTATVESVAVTSTPRFASAEDDPPDTYGRGERIRFTATFSAPVAVTGAPGFEFNLGAAARRAVYDPGASTANTVAFRYIVRAGDSDTDGIAVSGSPTAFRLDTRDRIRTTSIREDAILDHDRLDPQSGHRVNGSQSVVAEVTTVAVTSTPQFTSPGAGTPDTYGRGDTIELTVTFSEPVTVTGTPEIVFSIGAGDDARRAVHDAGASTPTTMVFRYTVQAADRDTDGIRVDDHATTFKVDIDDRIRTTASELRAVLVHDPPGTQSGHRVDGSMSVRATVESVSVTSRPHLRSSAATRPDTYGVGDAIELSVSFDKPVTVTGTPELGFALDDGTRVAAYDEDASTTTVLAFHYTVLAGDRATGGIRVGDHTTTFRAVEDDRVLTTANNLPALLDHDPLDAQDGHRVDGSRSTSGTATVESVAVASTPLLSSTQTDPEMHDTYGRGEDIEIKVTFSEEVDVEGDPEFELMFGAVPRRADYEPAMSTPRALVFRRSVLRDDSDRDGVRSPDRPSAILMDSDESIRTRSVDEDAILDHAKLDLQSGHKVDGSRSAVAEVRRVAVTSTPRSLWPGSASPDTYAPGETIELTATFTEPVTVTGTPEFEFLIGKTARRAAYDESASTATELVFRYTVQGPEQDGEHPVGISVGAHQTGSADDRQQTFRLGAGDRILTTSNNVDAFLEHRALGRQDGHRVGAPVRATVASVMVTSTPQFASTEGGQPDTYGRGEAIGFTVTFDRPVTVTGSPGFGFALGDRTRVATYAASASTPTAVAFHYVVQDGDADTDGVRIGDQTSTLRLAPGDFVTSNGGVNADLDHAEQGTRTAHKVDASRTVAARITSVDVTSTPLLTWPGSSTPDTYGVGEIIEFTVTFDAPVRVTGAPQFEFALGRGGSGTFYYDRHFRRAAYDANASTATAVVFRYPVVYTPGYEASPNGISVGGHTETFKLRGTDSIVTTSNGAHALLDHDPLGRLTRHKVNSDRSATARIDSVVVTSTPSLTAAGSSSPDTYGAGETIAFTVTFDRAVLVRGTPEFEFSLGNPGESPPAIYRRAAHDPGASTATALVFRYTVRATDEDTNGIWVGDRSRTLRLDGDDAIATASLGSPTNNAANLDHRAPGQHNGKKVDGSRTAAYTVPGAPQSLSAVADDGRVRLTWAAGTDGGLAIQGYQRRHAPGSTVPSSVPPTVLGNVTEDMVTGLDNGREYTFEVRAVNALGGGAPATVTATPRAPVCDVPDTAGRRVIWSATLGVARLRSGHGFDTAVHAGSLSGTTFTVGRSTHRIAAARVKDFAGDAGDGNLVVRLEGRNLSDEERAALTLHVCDAPFRFQAATPRAAQREYEWTGDLDWTGLMTRSLRLSLPAHNPATGQPGIAGRAPRVGARLNAVTTDIVDFDGLPETLEHQWVRVDADGSSNPMDIAGATGASYVVGTGDVGKRLRVVVSFTDGEGLPETLTSEAWPAGSATIAANQVPASSDKMVTIDEDPAQPYTFTRADFAFTDGDAGEMFGGVRIVTPQRAGLLSLDGAAVTADTFVTPTELDAGALTFAPSANANGAPYAAFTFRVSDGGVESDPANTLTINVTPVEDPTTGLPEIRGTPRVGRTLFASASALEDPDGLPSTFTWRWVRVDGDTEEEISDATSDSYAPGTADVGKRIRVRVSFTDGGGTDVNLVSVTTARVAAAATNTRNATGAPYFWSGMAVEGATIRFNTERIADPDGLRSGPFQLEWLRCDAIGNECDTTVWVGDSYTLTAADVGRRMRVRASFVDKGGNFEYRTSGPWPGSLSAPISTYPPCTESDVRPLEQVGRRAILSGKMTVAEASGVRVQEGQVTDDPTLIFHTFHYGFGMREDRDLASSFGRMSEPTEFQSGGYVYFLRGIRSSVGFSGDGERTEDLQLVLLPDAITPGPPRPYGFTGVGELVDLRQRVSNQLMQHVQLHVCNETFPFSNAGVSQNRRSWAWGGAELRLVPGTTRIVRLSERLPDAYLRDLNLSEGKLSPGFLAERTEYSAAVPEPVTRITVRATAHSPMSTVRFLDESSRTRNARTRDATTPSSSASMETDLALGENSIVVVVTDEDGRATRTYRTIVTRNLSTDATLRTFGFSAGTLSPAFSPGQTSYTAAVGSDGPRIVTVTAEPNHAAASVELLDGNDVALADADPESADTFEVDLAVGANVIKARVTAQDGTTIETYAMTVTREVSTDATLKALELDRGTLEPAFSPGQTSYAATVGIRTRHRVTVTPRANHPSARIEFLDARDAVIADADPTSAGTFERSLGLGENVVKVRVTAEDGATTRTYTVTITAIVRAEVSVAAVHPSAAPALALPEYRVTVTDPQAQDFEVTLSFTQAAAYLASTTRVVTIPAGQTAVTEKLAISTDLALDSGDLTATVTGGGLVYLPAPAPANAATVRVVVVDPLLTATWAENAYTVDEDGSVTVEARLRTAEGVPMPREDYAVAVATLDGTATAGLDYPALDTVTTLTPEDWTADGAVFMATVSQTVETTDDESLEGDETFHVRLSGAEGHLAPGSDDCPTELQDLGGTTGCATRVTIDDDESLSVTGVTVTSTPVSGNTYLADEVIRFTARFTADVTVNTTDGTPLLGFTLGATTRTAAYESGSDSDALVFAYTVVAGELDRDGISWGAGAIALEGSTIRLETTDADLVVDADLAFVAAAAQSAHKVDAKAPVLEHATWLGTEVELLYDEALDESSTPGKAAYTLTVTDSTTTPTVDSVEVNGASVNLTLSATPDDDATVNLAYVVPSGADAMKVKDLVGNAAKGFSDRTVELGEQLRLIKDGREHPSEGRLEARYRGEWGTVCEDYWTDTEADLVCRLLGHQEGSTGNGGRFLGAYFGEGTGRIWLDNLLCTGRETSLRDCGRRRNDGRSGKLALGEHDCTHRSDVGVQCKVSGAATAPQVTGAPVLSDAPGEDDRWGPDETLEVTLTFTEEVEVDTAEGTPSLEVVLGADEGRRATYRSGSGTVALVFAYRLVDGDGTHGAVAVTESTLATHGGHIGGVSTRLAAELDHDGASRQGTDAVAGALTARFENVPAVHRGVGHRFTFEVRFSAEPDGLSFRSMAGPAFEVTGGAVTGARRLESGKNHRWEVEVTPSVKGAVTVTLRETTDCAAAHAVCTEDGDRLTDAVAAVVPGLPAFSVADAQVREGSGARLDFEVTLDRAASVDVAVRYETADGTAKAGTAPANYVRGLFQAKSDCANGTYDGDYIPASDLLIFETGMTSRTVSVPVCVDAHDEGSETMRLLLTETVIAQGIWVSSRIEDGEATGTIENTGAIPKAWIARFGRTVADQMLDAVDARLRASRAGGVSVSLAGRQLGGAAPLADGQVAPVAGTTVAAESGAKAESALRVDAAADAEETARLKALSDWLSGETADERRSRERSPSLTGQQVLMGSSFSLASETAGGGFAALWGRMAHTRFAGREDVLNLDGDVTTGLVGADYAWDRWKTGLVVSRSIGEGGYWGESSGDIEATVTALTPWAGYAVTERVSVWGAAGYGAGELKLTPAGEPGLKTDLGMMLAAAGARGALLDGEGPRLDAVTDVRWVRTTTARVSSSTGNLASAQADVTRLRLGLEGSWPLALGEGVLGGGATATPRLALGVRHDGGDAETGFGADIGGGVSLAAPAEGLTGSLDGRGVLTHEASGLRDRVISGTLAWDAPPPGRGPTLSLSQSIGVATSGGGKEALLARATLEGLAANDNGAGQRRLEARFGYGFAAFGGRFTLTPGVGVGLSDAGRDYRLGWRLVRSGSGVGSLELSVEATRRESANDDTPPEHGVGARLTARW